MRVLEIGCIALALAALSLPSHANARSPDRAAAMQELRNREGSRWTVSWDEATGAPRSIMGDRSALPSMRGSSNSTLAVSFLQRNRGLFPLREGLDGFLLRSESASQGIRHLRLAQTYRGVPVVGGEYAVALDDEGAVRMVNGRFRPGIDVDVTPRISSGDAEGVARREVADGAEVAGEGEAMLAIDVLDGNPHLVWQLQLTRSDAPGLTLVRIDAHTGALLVFRDITPHISYVPEPPDPEPTGPPSSPRANVFPIDGSQPYAEVDLDGLTATDHLESSRLLVRNGNGQPSAYSGVGDFRYLPGDPHFTEANVYYHAQRYLGTFIPSLGYALPYQLTANANNPVEAPAGTYYLRRNIYLGAASGQYRNHGHSSDIIAHEVQHAVTESKGINYHEFETQALSEALSDYFAAAFTNDPDIGEWGYVGCGNGVTWLDSDPAVFKYANYGNVATCITAHDRWSNGMILSGALWDLRLAIGSVADRMILQALDYLPSGPDFSCLADAMIQNDADHYGGGFRAPIEEAFANRGIGGIRGLLDGPSEITRGERDTFMVRLVCDVCPFTVTWYHRLLCDGEPCEGAQWSVIGTGPIRDVEGEVDFEIRADIVDSRQRELSLTKAVTIVEPAPPTVQIEGPLALDPDISAEFVAVAQGVPPLAYRWEQRFRVTPQSYSGWNVLADIDDRVLAGSASEFELRVTVTDPFGRTTSDIHHVDVDGELSVTPVALSAGPPVPGTSEVTLTTEEAGRFRLTVLDAAGRRVVELANRMFEAGRHQLRWATGSVPPGVYFYRLENSRMSTSRRFVVLR